jgi:hypothetical protein
MESIAQVNNLAQFMRIVSAARSRNGSMVNNSFASVSAPESRNAHQAARPRSFQETAGPGVTAYTNTRQVIHEAKVESSAKPSSTRVLGTRFDAYA